MNYKEERKKKNAIQELILKYKMKKQIICKTRTDRQNGRNYEKEQE
jgi:hypothetical protein